MVKKIREIEKESNIYEKDDARVTIIGLTGHDSSQIQKVGIESGMDLVIRKPPTLNHVKEIFKKYLFKGKEDTPNNRE